MSSSGAVFGGLLEWQGFNILVGAVVAGAAAIFIYANQKQGVQDAARGAAIADVPRAAAQNMTFTNPRDSYRSDTATQVVSVEEDADWNGRINTLNGGGVDRLSRRWMVRYADGAVAIHYGENAPSFF